MKFNYRFTSALPPEDIALRIAAGINPSVTSQWKDTFKNHYNPAVGEHYFGKVDGLYFTIKGRAFRKRLLPGVLITGSIVAGGKGSMVRAQLCLGIAKMAWEIIMRECFVAGLFLVGDHFGVSKGLLGDVIVAGVVVLLLGTVGALWESLYEMFRLKRFFRTMLRVPPMAALPA
jgi:hypothetical protein